MLELCVSAGLVEAGVLAVDGTKLAAHQSATGRESSAPIEIETYVVYELEDGRVV